MGMGNGHEDGDGGVDAAGDGMEWAELGDLLLGRRLVCSALGVGAGATCSLRCDRR